MKFLCLVVGLVFTVSSLRSQTGWQRITPPSLYGSSHAYFWSADSGAVGHWSTTDGGKQWSKLTVPVGAHEEDTDYYYDLVWNDFFALSLTKYFAIGSTVSITGPYYFRWYSYQTNTSMTVDGGTSWVSGGGPFCSQGSHVRFRDNRYGFAFSDAAPGCGEGPGDFVGEGGVLVTRDGGNNWFYLTRPNPLASKLFVDADFINDSMIIVSANDGILNWGGEKICKIHLSDSLMYVNLFRDTLLIEPVQAFMGGIPLNETLLKVTCVTDSIFLGFLEEQFVRSTDQGRNWSVITNCAPGHVAVVRDSIIYAAFDREGWAWIYKSSDYGATWKPQLQSSGTSFIAVSAPNDRVAYAFGENGIAYKTIDGGGTTLSVPAVIEQRGFRVYPNPASTWVEVEGAVKHLRVFDAVGRKILLPVRNEQVLSVQIDVTGWPGGIYTVTDGLSQARFVVAP